jgi:hypothetical protein
MNTNQIELPTGQIMGWNQIEYYEQIQNGNPN